MQNYEFTIVVDKDEDGKFIAICPSLQGCYTEGDSTEEAMELIQDAIRLHLEDRIAMGEPINEEVLAQKIKIAI